MVTNAIALWLDAPDSALSSAKAQVRSELEKAGFRFPSSPADAAYHLAVSDTCSSPAALHAPPGMPALAVLVSEAPPPAAYTLGILQQGFADSIWWPPDGSAASHVAARLRRWDAIRALEQSPTVQELVVGDCPAWRMLLREVIEAAAFSPSSVLITGETGTGKDVLANLIHRLGGSKAGLTILDCTTLSPELCGSELFGHEKGAFTGAANARDGAFAQAHGGTLFLDEVGELPLPLQAQLLRSVQEGQYKRIGSNSWQPSRFRLICATNRDLEADVTRGAFRADLYYRIAAWRCRTPALRERSADILPLAEHFLRQLAPRGEAPPLDAAVREYLLTREYPGNVRDLRQTVTRLWHRHCGHGAITAGCIPPEERPQTAMLPPPTDALEQAVRGQLAMGHSLAQIKQAAADTALRIVLGQEQGSNQRAAQRLGVTDRALQLWRKGQAT